MGDITSATPHRDCGQWVCTYYGLPSLPPVYEGQNYGRRWGLCFAHLSWLCIVYMIMNFTFVAPVFGKLANVEFPFFVALGCFGFVMYGVLTLVLFMIMFLRDLN